MSLVQILTGKQETIEQFLAQSHDAILEICG